MSLDEVMAQLEGWGSESTRKINTRRGWDGPQFGVLLGKVRSLAAELGTDHDLALRLWATGNLDAMVLAVMLFDPARISTDDGERMVRSLKSYWILDELVYRAISPSPGAEELRLRWMEDPEELVARAGWALLVARVMKRKVKGLDLPALMKRIEGELPAAPYHQKETMNRALVEIGVKVPELRDEAIAIGERLGRWDPRPVPKGCTSSYAPEWIAAVVNRKPR